MDAGVSYHELSPEAAATHLGVNPECGLNEQQAAERLLRFGPNRLSQAPPPSLLQLLIRQLRSFIVILLLVAAVLSFGLGETENGLAILLAVALNAFVGFVMDSQAEREIAALQALSAPRARVLRGGNVHEVDAQQLVPGDVVRLEAGDRVPADGRVLAGSLSVDESLLTGESVPIDKHSEPIADREPPLFARRNEAFSGSLVTVGSGTLLVTQTGAATEIGRIGTLLTAAPPPKLPLNERLESLGRYLVWTVGAVALVIVLIGLWQRQPFWPLVETAIVLAIAAIPEGLPSVATLALAAGARRLARHGLRLRTIGALEALGSVTTLCLDKTGTLTANAMTVQQLRVPGHRFMVEGAGWEPCGPILEGAKPPEGRGRELLERAMRAAQLCNDATLEAHGQGWHIHGDPSEGALLVAAAKAGLADRRPDCDRMQTLPAGRDHPWMVAVYRLGDEERAFIKGAPEQVLARCGTVSTESGAQALDEDSRKAWLEANHEMADQALRVFALAEKRLTDADEDLEHGWRFLGLVGMADPPRAGVAEALRAAHQAGIRTVMITGDQRATAQAIARKLDMADGREPVVVTGSQAIVPEATAYARATPESKYALVQALQAVGEVVVMTGDGVNDAPALRAAVVGVAMGRGTDVAKEAAAVVLMDEQLPVLLYGIQEGRSAFLNIQKAVDFLLTCSTTTMLVVLIATITGHPLPLLPLQILYLNILTHSFPALGLSMEPSRLEVMERAPLPRKALLLPPLRFATILWHSLMIALVTLGVGAWGASHAGLAHGRTLIFVTLAFALMLHAFSDRSASPFGGYQPRGIVLVLSFVGMALALQLLAIFWPPLQALLGMTSLRAHDWLGMLVAAGVSLLAVELSKWALPPEMRPGEDEFRRPGWSVD